MRRAVVALAACIIGCHPNLPLRSTDDLIAGLQYGPCYGNCPVYDVVIYSDGMVEYIGSQYVEVHGVARAQLSALELGELRRLFARADYFALDSRDERNECIDIPRVTTFYRHGPRDREIRHCGHHAPPELLELEAGLERLLHVERWVGDPSKRHDGD